MKPKIIVNNVTKRIISFGYCEFEALQGHTIYDINDEQLPDEPRFCKYTKSTGIVSIDQSFKDQILAHELILSRLSGTDSGMVEVIEDLISLLESKGIVSESELPQASKDKLDNRRTIRSQL